MPFGRKIIKFQKLYLVKIMFMNNLLQYQSGQLICFYYDNFFKHFKRNVFKIFELGIGSYINFYFSDDIFFYILLDSK